MKVGVGLGAYLEVAQTLRHFFRPGCETLRIEGERLRLYAGKDREMPQAIGVGIHMLKNRVASQVWQERADKLTRQGVSQQCRAIKIFRMSVKGGI